MLVSAELASRLVKKAVARDPSLAGDARALSDLSRAAMRNPSTLATDPDDKAFLLLDSTVATIRREVDDALDARFDALEDPSRAADPAPETFPRSTAALARVLKVDSNCYDALLLQVATSSATFDQVIQNLVDLEPMAREWCASQSALYDGPVADLWDGVFMRPWLRIKSRTVDYLVQAACYREAARMCEEMLRQSPTDAQGMRNVLALVYARLEDEDALLRLDAQFEHKGTCWMHLARAVLLYKLGRLDAARRAVVGLTELCPGAPYFLANPCYVEPYLPDRPAYTPGTPRESLLATFEADFLVVDTPEFVQWALSIERFSDAVAQFGRKHGGEY